MATTVQINCTVVNFDGTPPVLEIETNAHRYTAVMESDTRAIFSVTDEPPHGWWLEWAGHRERQPGPFPDVPGSYEGPALTYAPVVIIVPPDPRPTELIGRAWTRGGAPFYPWYATLMWALGGWMRGDRARVEQHFTWLASVGATGFRMLAQVDWSGEEIDPDAPGYEHAFAEMLDVAYAHYGLLAKITLVGGGVRDAGDLATKVRNVVAGRREAVLLLEGVNEGNGDAEQARTMLDILRDLDLPMAAGFGNQGIEYIEEVSAYCGANVACFHTERGGGPDRMLRQVWDLKEFAPLAADDGEGPGPGASADGQLDDAIILAAKRAGAALAGGAGAFCLHTGAGVYGRARGPSGGREACPANIWETPHIASIADHVRHACDPLDLGVENWTRYNTNFPVKVVEGPFEKIYGGRSMGRFGQIVTATRNPDGTPAPRIVLEGRAPYRVWVPGGALLADVAGGRVEVGGYNAYVVQGDDQGPARRVAAEYNREY